MGEAKQRKLTDSNYGSVSNKIRGLIISSPTIMSGNNVRITGGLDHQELRSSLLYWDRLTWPSNNAVDIKGSPEIEYLSSVGILSRIRYEGSGKLSDILIAAQAYSFEKLEKESPGVWSIGGGENSLIVNSGDVDRQQGSIMQLYNAIPVPKADVPLDDILKFRQKRRPELLALRSYIEALAEEISNSSDNQEALKDRLAKVDSSCSDLIKVSREWQSPVYLANLKASFNFDLNKLGANAVKAWVASETLGLSSTTKAIAAGAAGITSMFNIGADIKMQNLRRGSSPFKYAYLIQRDLI